MRHPLKLTNEEKINIWLDLCDFTFHLTKSTLSSRELKEKLKRNRQVHLKDDYLILSRLARLK